MPTAPPKRVPEWDLQRQNLCKAGKLVEPNLDVGCVFLRSVHAYHPA